jgi:hypothetical protein
MVFVLDEGGIFEAPLEKIWELNRSTIFHKHPSMKGMRAERTADPSTIFLTWESEAEGTTFKNKAKLIFLPPIGFTMDFVEGPLAGSRDFEYYTPMGGKTGITCVGDWKWAPGGLSDDQLRALVIEFYDEAFREDKENLAKMISTK